MRLGQGIFRIFRPPITVSCRDNLLSGLNKRTIWGAVKTPLGLGLVVPRGELIEAMLLPNLHLSPSFGLLLNRRLIEAPIASIDYVITHELCHIAEPQHGSTFFRILNQVLPDWQTRKESLEQVMA